MTISRVRMESVIKWTSRIGSGLLLALSYDEWGIGAAVVTFAACVIYGMGLTPFPSDEGDGR